MLALVKTKCAVRHQIPHVVVALKVDGVSDESNALGGWAVGLDVGSSLGKALFATGALEGHDEESIARTQSIHHLESVLHLAVRRQHGLFQTCRASRGQAAQVRKERGGQRSDVAKRFSLAIPTIKQLTCLRGALPSAETSGDGIHCDSQSFLALVPRCLWWQWHVHGTSPATSFADLVECLAGVNAGIADCDINCDGPTSSAYNNKGGTIAASVAMATTLVGITISIFYR